MHWRRDDESREVYSEDVLANWVSAWDGVRADRELELVVLGVRPWKEYKAHVPVGRN